MPKVKFDPALPVDCKVSFDGKPSSRTVVWWTEVGTDFDDDGNMDAGSKITSRTHTELERVLGAGTQFEHMIADVIVLPRHNPDSDSTSVTVTLTQNGIALGTLTKPSPRTAEFAPLLFRFWD